MTARSSPVRSLSACTVRAPRAHAANARMSLFRWGCPPYVACERCRPRLHRTKFRRIGRCRFRQRKGACELNGANTDRSIRVMNINTTHSDMRIAIIGGPERRNHLAQHRLWSWRDATAARSQADPPFAPPWRRAPAKLE